MNLTPKAQAILAGIGSAVTGYIAYFIALPPNLQTGIMGDIIAILPPQYQTAAAGVTKTLATFLGLWATYKAAHSGPTAPPIPAPPAPPRPAIPVIPLIAILALLPLSSCTTAQITATRTIADPIVSAVVSGYAATYGVPPPLTQGVVGIIQNQLWGMLAQAEAKQPVAQGASISKVGAAVAKVVANSPVPAPVLITNALASLNAIPPTASTATP